MLLHAREMSHSFAAATAPYPKHPIICNLEVDGGLTNPVGASGGVDDWRDIPLFEMQRA